MNFASDIFFNMHTCISLDTLLPSVSIWSLQTVLSLESSATLVANFSFDALVSRQTFWAYRSSFSSWANITLGTVRPAYIKKPLFNQCTITINVVKRWLPTTTVNFASDIFFNMQPGSATWVEHRSQIDGMVNAC